MSVGIPVAGSYMWGTGSAPVAVPYPAGITAGDLLLMWVGISGYSATFPAVPAGGWESIRHQSSDGTSPTSRWMWKVATGSESGTVAVTALDASIAYKARMWRVSGVDPVTPVYAVGAFQSNVGVAQLPVTGLGAIPAGGARIIYSGVVNNGVSQWAAAGAHPLSTLIDDGAALPSSFVGYTDELAAGTAGTVLRDHQLSPRGHAVAFILNPYVAPTGPAVSVLVGGVETAASLTVFNGTTEDAVAVLDVAPVGP